MAFIAPLTVRPVYATSLATVSCNRGCDWIHARPLRVHSSSSSLRLPRMSCDPSDYQEGDRVKVIQDIQFFHVPKNKGKGVSTLGMEGSVVKVWRDDVLSINRPVVVEFADSDRAPKFQAHFTDDELQKL